MANHIFDKGFISTVHKEVYMFNTTKKKKNPIRKISLRVRTGISLKKIHRWHIST